MAPVRIKGVNKFFGSLQVVRDVSVDIEDGEFVILVGPSGCGKSTLLRMCAGLESITSGEIEIDGRVVNRVPPNERDIAMVFQNYALYPQMTVAQNMGFALEMARVPKQQIAARVNAAAETLGLTPLLSRFPRHLSGGQRQRVAMGRAIVREPSVFLFDEPLSNLDAKLRVRMRSEIRRLQQRLGTTSIYVTHDQVEAMTMADKIVVMNEGVVEQVGAPLDLYDGPDNLFVAGFIGSPAMNFLKGRMRNDTFVLPSGKAIGIPGAPRTQGEVTLGEVTLGVRPEHLVPGGPNPVDAIVTVVEPMGSETLIGLDLDGTELACLHKQRLNPRIGEVLPISMHEAPLHVFDAATGARL